MYLLVTGTRKILFLFKKRQIKDKNKNLIKQRKRIRSKRFQCFISQRSAPSFTFKLQQTLTHIYTLTHTQRSTKSTWGDAGKGNTSSKFASVEKR